MIEQPLGNTVGSLRSAFAPTDDPVTTDPKGEASDMLRGNTPALVISTEAMHEGAKVRDEMKI